MKVGLNLLRYPALERQQRWRRQSRQGVIGLGVGILLATLVLCAMSWHTDALKAETKSIQAQWDERQRRVIARQQRQAQNLQLQKVLGQLDQVQTHQKAWVLLQSELQSVLSQHGLRVQRLQVEAGRLNLQGQAVDAKDIGLAAQSLSERWGTPLALQSLEADATKAPAVTFAWQASWSALFDGSGPPQRGQP